VVCTPRCPLPAHHTRCAHPLTPRAPVSLAAGRWTDTLSHTLTYAYSRPACHSALLPAHTPVCVCLRCIVALHCHFYTVTYTIPPLYRSVLAACHVLVCTCTHVQTCICSYTSVSRLPRCLLLARTSFSSLCCRLTPAYCIVPLAHTCAACSLPRPLSDLCTHSPAPCWGSRWRLLSYTHTYTQFTSVHWQVSESSTACHSCEHTLQSPFSLYLLKGLSATSPL